MANRSRSEEITINLTPMIDVVFLLVIFFLVGSRFGDADKRVSVSVPSSGQMRSITRVPDERVVTIEPGGQITFDGQPVTINQLTTTLQRELANHPDMKIAVRGAQQTSFQPVMEVLAAIDVAGVEKIAIATQSSTRR